MESTLCSYKDNHGTLCTWIGFFRCLGCDNFSCKRHTMYSATYCRQNIDDERVTFTRCMDCWLDPDKREAISQKARDILKENLEKIKDI